MPEKTGLKLYIKKNSDLGSWSHHFMVNRREKVEAVVDFFGGGNGEV